MLYAQFRTTTTASIVTITTAQKVADDLLSSQFYHTHQAVLLTPTAPNPTRYVGQSSLTDVDVLLILTARFSSLVIDS